MERGILPGKNGSKGDVGILRQHFSTVELNSTFRQMPRVNVVESWAGQVPESFRFVLKAPQIITHYKRLVGVEKKRKSFCTPHRC